MSIQTRAKPEQLMNQQADLKKPRDTKSEVLFAAARNFREKGYAAVSLRDIAKSAGLTTGSLYYHYRSKEEVVKEILELGHTNVRQEVERAISTIEATGESSDGISLDHADLIRLAVKAHIACLFGEDNIPAANIRIFSQVPREVRADSLKSRHDYEALWENILRKAQQSGFLKAELDIPTTIPILFGAMNWTIEWFDPSQHKFDQVADQILTLLKA